MKEYVVIWLISNWISLPCPDGVAMCTEHWEREVETYSERFETRDSAYAYYELLKNKQMRIDEKTYLPITIDTVEVYQKLK